jgi:hypothetical protein
MNTETIAADAMGSIQVGRGASIHWGSKFGPECGAGFNRRGSSSTFSRVKSEITCAKCLKIKASRES